MTQIFNNLTKIIKESSKIVIMTHKNPDFDGFGSALALQHICYTFKKNSYICIDKDTIGQTLKKTWDYLKEKNVYHHFINKKEVLKSVDENTLLIVLDTHKIDMVEIPELLALTKKIVVIDHHIKSKDAINNTVFTYINSNLSSTVEFIANYVKYLNKTINSVIATVMEVGLEIDTNNFKLKTTDKTFETAAFLIKLGADNVLKQELLKEEKNVFIRRNKVIEKSFMISSNMVMCIADDIIYDRKELAIIAEELLQFENVEASFVLGKINETTVAISARSISNINVERYMSKFGGGGHFNEAAAQVENGTIENIKNEIIAIIGG